VAKEIICGTAEVERIAESIRSQQARTRVPLARRFPIGAEPQSQGVSFRVWAPRSQTVSVEEWTESDATDRIWRLHPEEHGYFSGEVQGASSGMLYKLRLDNAAYPDPASRFQPQGPHGPSQVVDSNRFRWTDEEWRGPARNGQVIYELHLGTFTREGTWRAGTEKLPDLAQLGITMVEVMPVADFCGRFGWGYDGVNMFAPTRLYGTPDDMRALIDRAHGLGISVILDVVYNHFGPDGNYIGQFSSDYFSTRYKNEWGEPLNFDGPNAGPVREFFITNAAYWIEEFHLDGLRLDATHQIFDASPTHILSEIGSAVRAHAQGRSTYIVNENECQHSSIVRSQATGGCDLDALWNDDFHHAARVAMTGEREAYYTDYSGAPQEIISAIKWGYLYQGQWYRWQKKRRGTPAFDLDPERFVNFIQNHDQVANSLRGERIHQLTSPGRYRAMTALLLLAPQTPMIFMGQEFAASTPFLYFADHHPELAALVSKGRLEFLKQFPGVACPGCESVYNEPENEETFRRCILDWSECEKNAATFALHHDLIALRRTTRVFARSRRGGVDGAVLGPEAFVLRFFAGHSDGQERPGDERLLIVNLGCNLRLDSVAEPLLAPSGSGGWKTVFSTESPCYDGKGAAPVECDDHWCIPGHAASVLAPDEDKVQRS
jgi:maltooligosyltrehalose trehalohydrolase